MQSGRYYWDSADYTEIVVGLEEELAEEKERCEGLTAELHALFENGPFEEIRRQAQNIKGLAVLGLCAVGKDCAIEGVRAAFLNIAESADVIMEDAGKKKAPDASFRVPAKRQLCGREEGQQNERGFAATKPI